VLTWLPLLHAAALLAFFAVRWAAQGLDAQPHPLWWPRLQRFVDLIGEFTPAFFLPLPLWLLTTLVARTWKALRFAAAPWLIFAALYGELFLPTTLRAAAAPAATRPAVPIRIMTFNVLAQSRPADGVVAAVQRADPDVLLVQELGGGFSAAITAALGDRYPEQWLQPGGWGGTGIWSKYPIYTQETLFGSQRGANWQHVTLNVDGRPFELVNLHLSTPVARKWGATLGLLPVATGEDAALRRIEVAGLAPRLQAYTQSHTPLVVVGDLNLTDQTPEYRRLRATGLEDAQRTVGFGFGNTFPAGRSVHAFGRLLPIPTPVVRLDYVLYASMTARRVAVWPESGGSDHLPVVADLALP
jgi:endonuclease/exonuclease/phosphatase (EEP) superfamily protein YafD